MKSLAENLETLNQHYLELLKNLNRVLDINIQMLQENQFSNSLYGEALIIEDVINSFEVRIKEQSIFTMARFQPTASNLRLVIMLINSARLLERMGDILKANLKYIKEIEENSDELTIKLKENLFPMVNKIKNIYEGYITAFIEQDEKILYSLIPLDEEIDKTTKNIIQNISLEMKEKTNTIDNGINLIILTKKFERFSDHIIHLIFDLIYILKGENMRKLELLEEQKNR